MSTATPELLTVPKVMQRLHLGRSIVYDLIRCRRLASVTIGRSHRIPDTAVCDFIAHQIEEAP